MQILRIVFFFFSNTRLKHFQEPCSHKRRVRRDDEGSPATVEVFKGLYVNEPDSPDGDEVTSEKVILFMKLKSSAVDVNLK